jgi:hypothetical protein
MTQWGLGRVLPGALFGTGPSGGAPYFTRVLGNFSAIRSAMRLALPPASIAMAGLRLYWVRVRRGVESGRQSTSRRGRKNSRCGYAAGLGCGWKTERVVRLLTAELGIQK